MRERRVRIVNSGIKEVSEVVVRGQEGNAPEHAMDQFLKVPSATHQPLSAEEAGYGRTERDRAG